MTRRRALALAGATLATLSAARAADQKPDVEAAEDLMREHGVLRRALLVYAEAALRLSTGKGAVPVDALARTAALFRRFGEDYHERSLEEKHVFPVLIDRGGKNAELARTLKAQHDRGRQITEYITAAAHAGQLTASRSSGLVAVIPPFVRMYEHHAAIEDTVIFPAWKEAISESQYHELSEQFEELEQRMFGKDGFEDAVKQIADIEQAFGLGDLSTLTAPSPPTGT